MAARGLFTCALCADADSASPAYAVQASVPAPTKLEAFGMADVIFLAIGGGAFLAFAAFAAAMNRM